MLATTTFELPVTLVSLAWWTPVVLGCGFWWFWLGVGARLSRSMSALDEALPPEPARWPRVSVIVPACNEAHTLGPATDSRLADGYPDLQLVLVDDRSRDGTGALVDRLAADDPRVVARHVTELPDGWLGKNHALSTGVAASDGEWLVITDADVHFAPDTLRRVIAWAERARADFVAVFPEVPVQGFFLAAVMATFSRMFTISQRLWAVDDPRSSAFVGVGAFNLVRRAAYERTPGFEALRLDVADDLALGKLMKQSGARCRILSGVGRVSVRWYHSVGELAHGFEKNSFVMLGGRMRQVIGAVTAVCWFEAAPWVAVFSDLPWLRLLGAVSLTLGLVANLGLAWRARLPPLAAALSPLGTVLFAWVLLRAGWIGRRAGAITWRGTSYPLELLRRNQYLLRKPGDEPSARPPLSCPR